MTRKNMVVAVTLLGMALGVSAADKAVDLSKLPPASTKTGVAYATDIRPILEKNCFKCHGAEKQKGRLRLDSLEGALKGSQDGNILVPGDSAKSTIVRVVSRLVEDEAMPPKGKGEPLTRDEVGLIRAWINQGAK